MSGGFHVLVTANIEINASNFAYFDALIPDIDLHKMGEFHGDAI